MRLILVEHHHHYYSNSESSTLEPLLQQWMEQIMAQLDDLMNVLGAIHNDVTNVLDRAKSLEDQLTQLQQTTPPQVDLQPAIDAATAIREQLEGTASATGSASGATDAQAQELGDAAGTTSSTDTSTGDTSAPGASTSDTAASTDSSDTSIAVDESGEVIGDQPTE